MDRRRSHEREAANADVHSSFPVTYRVAAKLTELHNLDLLRKGLYRVVLRLRAAPGGAPLPPARCRSTPATLLSSCRGSEVAGTDVGAAHGSVGDDGYVSRSVLFRYADEAFDLSETVEWDVALPPGGDEGGPRLALAVELERADAAVDERTSSSATPPGAGVWPLAVRRSSTVGSFMASTKS